jgi:NAD-dependent SIR2 family protein deacetylase
MPSNQTLEQAVNWITKADALLITAGAGMGVDSGLPDFRGDQGFWRTYPALSAQAFTYLDIATPDVFDSMPEIAWGFYGHRLNLYRNTPPHAGFSRLLEIGARMKHGYFVYTSNVDGHFAKAGFDANRIVECHGSIHYMQCQYVSCLDEGIWSAESFTPQLDKHNCHVTSALPFCPFCEEVCRPNIMMFSDFTGWNDERQSKQLGRYQRWLAQAENLVVIECGAGTNVNTIRKLGESLQAPLIRINTKEAFSKKSNAVCIELPALQAIEAIYQKLQTTCR